MPWLHEGLLLQAAHGFPPHTDETPSQLNPCVHQLPNSNLSIGFWAPPPLQTKVEILHKRIPFDTISLAQIFQVWECFPFHVCSTNKIQIYASLCPLKKPPEKTTKAALSLDRDLNFRSLKPASPRPAGPANISQRFNYLVLLRAGQQPWKHMPAHPGVLFWGVKQSHQHWWKGRT